MKKLKWIFLWIVWFFWLSFTYWYNSIPFYVDYWNLSWSNISFKINSASTSSPINYWSGSIDTTLYSYFLRNNTSSLVFNYSLWSLSSSFSANYLPSMKLFYDSNWNKVALYVTWSRSDYWAYYFPITSSASWLTTGNIISQWVNNWAYIRVFSNNTGCIRNSILSYAWSLCTPNYVFIHNNWSFTISPFGNLYDTDFNGVRYNKWPVAPYLWMWYSFGVVVGDQWWQNSWNNYYLTWNSFYNFRTVYFSWSSMLVHDWILAFRLNNYKYNNTNDDHQIIALRVTWNIADTSFLYSIYDCPWTAFHQQDCSFKEWWYVSNLQHLSWQPNFNSSDPYTNFLYFITKPYSTKFWNYYSSSNNQVKLYRQSVMTNPDYINSTASSTYNVISSTTLNLYPTTWIDVMWQTPVWSWWLWSGANQIVQSLWLMCQWPVYNTSDWLPPAICLNADWSLKDMSTLNECYVQTTFIWVEQVSQQFYCSNWFVLEQMELVGNWSGLFLTTCSWNNCSYDSLISLDNTWYSSDYFENFLNTTWYLWKCPRTYDNNVVIRPNLITLLNWHDIVKPINCMLAWFIHWRQSLEFWSGRHLIPDWPLLNFESDNWRSLYNFFDILLSFWIIIFAWKIFYLFYK